MEGETPGGIIKRLRKPKGISQTGLARLCGINRSYISQLESDKVTNITRKTAQKLAAALEVSAEIFLRATESPENLFKLPKDAADVLKELQSVLEVTTLAQVPVLGIVPGGEPWTPYEAPMEYVLIPKTLLNNVTHPYALKLSGDSLEGYGLHDGDTLVISPDAPIEDGRIFVVRIGNEVTAKKIYRENDCLKLVGSNGTFEVMEPRRVESLGRVIISGHWTKV